jgi:hypothetical protein
MMQEEQLSPAGKEWRGECGVFGNTGLGLLRESIGIDQIIVAWKR